MKTTTGPELSRREILGDHIDELLDCVDDIAAEQRARCAESTACDLAATLARHEVGGWPVAVDLIGTAPTASRCGLLTAAAVITRGQTRIDLARRAWQMRRELPPQEWIDHIGAASPTGGAARSDSPGHLMWLIELDDGLHRYCLMTEQDLGRGILAFTGIYPSLDELSVAEDIPGELRVDVALSVAVAGMTAATAIPGMWGVTTTLQAFGLFVRWHLWQLDPPSPAEADLVGWQPDLPQPTDRSGGPAASLRLLSDPDAAGPARRDGSSRRRGPGSKR